MDLTQQENDYFKLSKLDTYVPICLDDKYSSAVTQTDGSGDRLTAARMSVAGLVQTKDLERQLCSAM